MIHAASGLLDAPELRAGVAVGLVGLVAGVLLWAWDRKAPVAGLLVAAASLSAIADTAHVPGRVIVGVVLLGYAGLLADLDLVPRRAALVASLPGGVVLATAPDLGARSWTPWAVGIAAVAGGWLVAAADHRWGRTPLPPLLVAISAAGVYACVPDTEEALGLLGAAVALAPIGLLGARLGAGGALAVAGVLVWVSAVGGVGRAGAVVGGIAALGLLVVGPLTAAVARYRGPRTPNAARLVELALVHTAAVAGVTRVAGARVDAAPALVTALAVLVAAGGATALLERPWAGPGISASEES